MSDLLAARLQMGISLGFHIVFACIGMTMPWLMALASLQWLRTGDPLYRDLAKAWSKGVAVFFAVGAVSGTVLSLELGLLWPRFMEHAGAIIGLPFSWEGTAFFIEAIALGLFLYGWERLSPAVHFASGVVVGLSGLFSGVLVLSANAWMNSPSGFRWVDGHAIDIDPVAAMFNDAWTAEAVHMVIAAFVSTSFAVAGVHALRLLRGGHAQSFHRTALRIALGVGSLFALLQPLSGDFSAKDVARRQPAKLAAMEAHYHTGRDAALTIGGVPDDATQEVRYAIEIPYLLSVLAKGDPHAEVIGLDRIPADQRPPVSVCHFAFQIMVAAGMAMMAVGALYWWFYFRKPLALYAPWMLRVIAASTPLGFIAVEAGWTLTEVGRQPWIIYGVLRTADAVSPMPGLVWPLLASSALYLTLVFVLLAVMRRLVHATELALDAGLGPEPQHA